MQTFTKAERLSGKTALDNLFETGKSFNSFPFRLIWLEVVDDSPVPVQTVISVPKRSFKKAVDRNRIKRLIREGYRKNKKIIYNQINNKKIHLLFIYTARTIIEYKEMEQKIITALQHLAKAIAS